MDYTQKMLQADAIKGKTIVVTGGGSGLGKAMTTYFLELGANVVISSRNQEKIDLAAKELIEQTGGSVIAVPCDVRHYDQVEELVKKACDTYGSVDVLVNNAGVTSFHPQNAFRLTLLTPLSTSS